ncbi:ClbS/DfsB family four-helix bundle protein [Pseudoruegeria sp. SHC-113]|uniref:ClbS/DfsB family four-helix bundle protein n=1 Tax=Pseudoruegeria sp. SHC-113 TaxID=2855439 RepID=UPI0021BB6664|nr:ClbS/DfsB family four-helix bundle protein [Pseudoruegeria sp. SHC-113]MCT8159963.1 ClbS/DfsB family four-helix bundle protein [Pseudoruegeria sp. SHC-113]
MAAQSKPELLQITETEFTKLAKLLDGVSHAEALRKDAEDTSIKDVVAHRAHWIDLFLGWYAQGQAGAKVHFPAEGYKWNDLKRYNADLRARQAGLGWPEARALLAANHSKLIAFLTQSSEAQLYGGPMKGGNNAWTAGRWAEAAGPSHYRSAAKYIRARQRAMAAMSIGG